MSLNRGEKIAVVTGALIGLGLGTFALFFCDDACAGKESSFFLYLPLLPLLFFAVIAQGMGEAFPGGEVGPAIITVLNVISVVWFCVFYGYVAFLTYRFVVIPTVMRLRKR